MARAVMEGVACELRAALEDMQRAGLHVRRLRMVGGAAKSTVWPQIVADVTATPLALSPTRDAAAYGAAQLAAVGVGLLPGPEARFPALQLQEIILEPNPSHRQLYDDLYTRRRRLAERLALP
jgi:sugar (pentulose or hexulose) kinase